MSTNIYFTTLQAARYCKTAYYENNTIINFCVCMTKYTIICYKCIVLHTTYYFIVVCFVVNYKSDNTIIIIMSYIVRHFCAIKYCKILKITFMYKI